MAEEVASLLPDLRQELADPSARSGAYDRIAIRAFLKERGVRSVVPGKSDRKEKIHYDNQAYKGNNVIDGSTSSPSGFVSAGLKIGALSRHVTTSWHKTSFQPSASWLPSPSGPNSSGPEPGRKA